jgi:membrane-associated protease RseP (regulator of RpoE activity)
MSDLLQDRPPAPGDPGSFRIDAPSPDLALRLRPVVEQVMSIQDITRGDGQIPLRFRGSLQTPASEAFDQLRPAFEAAGHTPQMRREDGFDVIRAMPGVFGQARRKIPWMNIALLAATILSVLFVGVQGELYVSVFQAIAARIMGSAPPGVDPSLLPTDSEFWKAMGTGALYAISLLGILGTHEMGHYLMARRHGVHTTLPFFIPLPFNILGTLGAVIAMREPAPNRRIQFDIGIAGPLAGLIVAVPVMIVGLMLSDVGTPQSFVQQMPEAIRSDIVVFQEGQSLAYLGLKYLVFGQVLPTGDIDVWVHPVAFAAWAGFLVTMLNLLPIGQLDGGHVMFGLFGDKAGWVRWPIVGVLVVMAAAGSLADAGVVDLGFGWSGWWLWVLMILFLFRHHAPVLDEITELDPARKALGVAMLVIFVLLFTPRPIVISEPVAALIQGMMI